MSGQPVRRPWYLPQRLTSFDNLCAICNEINFDWLIRNDFHQNYYRVYESGKFRQYLDSSEEDLHSPSSIVTASERSLPELSLGFFADICNRKESCNFCQLVVSTVAVAHNKEWREIVALGLPSCSAHDIFCSLSSGPKEVAQAADWSRSTRQIFVEFRQYSQALSVFSTYKIHKISDEEVPFEGRLVKECIDTAFSTKWIRQFDLGGATSPGGNTTYGNVKDFRVVDVIQGTVSLVAGPVGCRYLALSYVWGGDQVSKNTRSRTDLLQQHGALFYTSMRLPQCILDAMNFTRAIGERYIWVDSLCIVQDDDIGKAVQINAMGTIYNCALATLIALYGHSAESGLPGVRNANFRWKQYVAEVQGLKLANRQSHIPALGLGTYTHRGWTYQEESLSRRAIRFSRDGAWFESENSCTPEDLYYAPHTSLKEERSVLSLIGPPIVNRIKNLQASLSILDIYSWHASLFSFKTLTNQADALNAFTGLLNIMKPYFRRPFVWAIPSAELEHGLLWRPQITNLTRRVKANLTSPIFPSWSWLGWQGGVQYDPQPPQRFGRISILDAQNGKDFTLDHWRNSDLGATTNWRKYHFGGRTAPNFYEEGRPRLRFLHPVSEAIPPSLAQAKFVLPGSHILALSAFCASPNTKPSKNLFDDEEPMRQRIATEARDIVDQYGHICGTLDLHVKLSTDDCVDIIAISRRAHANERTAPIAKPPDYDDQDVQAIRDEYAERQRVRHDNTAASYYTSDPIEELHWQLYDVLAIQWNIDIAERIGIGRCHVESFWDMQPAKRSIPLA